MIFISSTVGRLVIPFAGVYSASKWALAESFSYELRPFHVDVAIVEPGAYATNIFNAVIGPDDAERLASYGVVAKTVDRVGAVLALRLGKQGAVAEAIAAHVAAPAGTRPLRTPVPGGTPTAAINEASAPIQRSLLEAFGLGELLPKVPAAV